MTSRWGLAVAAFLVLVPLQETTGVIAGRVVDQFGNLAPGASVTVAGSSGRHLFITNQAGEFRADGLQPGQYLVEAFLSGFVRTVQQLALVVGGRTDVTLQITRPPAVGSIAGRVQTHEGTPIAGATVTLIGRDQRWTVVSDDQGVFPTFESVIPGTYQLEAQKSGFIASRNWVADPVGVFVSRGDRITWAMIVRLAPDTRNSVEGQISGFIGPLTVQECGQHREAARETESRRIP